MMISATQSLSWFILVYPGPSLGQQPFGYWPNALTTRLPAAPWYCLFGKMGLLDLNTTVSYTQLVPVFDTPTNALRTVCKMCQNLIGRKDLHEDWNQASVCMCVWVRVLALRLLALGSDALISSWLTLTFQQPSANLPGTFCGKV